MKKIILLLVYLWALPVFADDISFKLQNIDNKLYRVDNKLMMLQQKIENLAEKQASIKQDPTAFCYYQGSAYSEGSSQNGMICKRQGGKAPGTTPLVWEKPF
jgi:hypothetical protein